MNELDRFVQSSNMSRFASRLEIEQDEKQRDLIRRLLLEEEQRYGLRAEQLDMADERIGRAKQLIRRQQELIVRFAASGQDTSEADKLLNRLGDLLALFEHYRLQVLEALNAA